jgi:hypothetical protein
MEFVELNDVQPSPTSLGRRTRSRFRISLFIFLFLLIPVSIPMFFFADGGVERLEVSVDDKFGVMDENPPEASENAVQVWFQAIRFDPESQKAEFNVFPWPTDDLANGFSSSTQLKEDFGPIQIWVDSTAMENAHTFGPGDSIGAIKAEIDVLNEEFDDYKSDAYYPFDTYRLKAFAETYVGEVVDAENVDWQPIKTFDFFYTTPIPGFKISYERKANYLDSNGNEVDPDSSSAIKSQRQEGMISFQATISRSSAVKTISLIIGIFCMMSALTLTWISTGIWMGRRPPSMQALVWSAATVLGTVQLRDILPGRPRIGIGMDFVFFFPTLLVGLISSLLITTIWIRRDDWEI